MNIIILNNYTLKGTVAASMASIRDGYRHSRRTNTFYAMEDLPKARPEADFAIMLGSLNSVRYDPKKKSKSTCFFNFGAPSVDDIR